MTPDYLVRRLRRSALTVALGLCFAGGVQAQSPVGSIFGGTTSNTSVTIVSVDTGVTREITSDATGRFSFTQLPPGRYEVTSAGRTREVQVNVGTGTPVDFVDSTGATITLDTVTVIGTGVINPIDVSSVESTTIFTARQIDELPVDRNVTSVALLAPGTVRGDTGLGNLASFGGSSVAENGYYVNGFDVTNIRNFISFADVPFDAIAEQQVKTGGYGAEYGRSLGGVINVVTKSGSNEWKGGVSVYWTPGSLREEDKDVLSRDPLLIGTDSPYFVYRSANEVDQLTYNVYGGGPIIKDRLFVFGLVQGRDNTSESFFELSSQKTSNTKPNGLIKLDWKLSDNHLLEFTGIYNKSKDEYTTYENPEGQPYTGQHGTQNSTFSITDGGEVFIAKYTGYLTDNFTLSVLGGYLQVDNNFQSLLPGAECPPIVDNRAAGLPFIPLGCFNPNQFFIPDPDFGGGPDQDTRNAYRIDAEWQLGDHMVRFGYDHEQFESSHAGTTYSGGDEFYRYFNAGTFLGPDDAFLGDLVRVRTTFSESGTFEVINTAAYLEDSWQVTDNLLLYGGLRAETFENKNASGVTFVESDTLVAPRLGFSWDVNGDSTFKVFGNAGRYYIPVAANINISATSASEVTEVWYFLDGIDPTTGLPIFDPANVWDPLAVNGSRTPPDPRTVAATNLDPMHQDEFILGFQHVLGDHWSVGMRAIRREAKAGMDDTCAVNGYNQWAADQGFDPDFARDDEGIDMANCWIVNPGNDTSLAMDPDNDGDLEVYTVPASYIGLPEYIRKYHAVELFVERARQDGWYLQGSYTLAKSRGNVEGYVNSTLEQGAAGQTQDFDFAAFEHGSYGYLPNDRRHTLKLFGAYDITDEWNVSANLLIQSGRPVNCNGFIPVDALGIEQPDADGIFPYSGSSFYCLDPAGSIVDVRDPADPLDDLRYSLGTRGDRGRTPWTRTFDLGVGYTPDWADGKLNLQIKVFNVLNSGTVTEFNEFSTAFRTQTNTDADFLNDTDYLTPRSVRFTARYDF